MTKNLFYTLNDRDRLRFASCAMQSLIMRYGEDSVENKSLAELTINEIALKAKTTRPKHISYYKFRYIM